MFGGLLLKVMNRLRRFVVDLDCPACRHRFKPHADRPLTHWREFFARIPCPKCGYEMEIGEKRIREANPRGIVNKPRKTKIQRRELSGHEVEFFLPAGKIGAGLTAIGAVVSALILPLVYVTVIRGEGFPTAAKGPRVILSCMAFAGVGMLYGGLRQRFATYRLYLGPEWFCVRRTFLLRWTSRLPTRAIDSVWRDEAYAVASGSDSSMEEVYRCHAIQVKAGFRAIRFGSGLTDQEQLWLAQEIRAYLRGHGATALSKPFPPVPSA
jgi:hypothetical protein